MKTYRFVLILALAFHFSSLSGWAIFKTPGLEPVDRLVRNAEIYLAKHPSESNASYTLARIHYLAFATKSDHVETFRNRNIENYEPDVIPEWMRSITHALDYDEKEVKPMTIAGPELIGHASRAIRNFDEALRLDPKNGLYALGVASLLV